MATPRREHLLDVAEKLFYREGFHATGIDRIQAESGVSKTTLYKYFASKEALIVAVLTRSSEQTKAQLYALTGPLKGRGVERIRAVFSELHLICETADFNGCLFNNAAAEFIYLSPDIGELARGHMAWMHNFFLALLEEEQLPARLALLLLSLYEGILSVARVHEGADAIELAQGLLEPLLAVPSAPMAAGDG